jgi:UPF0755 protein
MTQSKRWLLGAFLLVVAIALGAGGARLGMFALSAAQPGSQAKAIVEIRKGESPAEITRALVAAGAVRDARLFTLLGRVTRQWKRLKAGEYEVAPSQTPIQIFATLASGVSVAHPVTVREGENMYEIADDIAAKGLAPKAKLLALCKDPKFIASMIQLGLKPPVGPTLEGYLFPDTYHFNRAMTAEDMLRQMVKHFARKWTAQEDARAAELGMTQLQVVTLASIVEKETGNPKDRAVISSVFHNRLRKKMRLQSDPTSIYGIWERYDGNIHKSTLAEVNDYNTYTLPGLPAGPISNPGAEAIQATLNPALTDYVYFVSHNDGTTEFTSTLVAHNAAVRKFQVDPKSRDGKSWRDLRKNARAPRGR